MLLDKIFYYEKELLIEINTPINPVYYFFDYDERSYSINMQFQHFHPLYEIHILLDDSANHIIEGKLFNLRKFDIVALRPNLLHKSEYPAGPPIKRLVIQFKFPYKEAGFTKEHEQILSVFNKDIPIYRFNRNIQEKLFGILNEIYRISNNNTSVNNLLIHNKFIEFLTFFYLFRDKNNYMPDTLNTTNNKIYTITAYVHTHYNEELSLEKLSGIFYMSNCYLSHLFKKITGFTLINYIQMVRIRNAQQLLLSSDKHITDIAWECGFTSFSQFNRVFNKFCKTTPREFKASAGISGMDYKDIPVFLRYD